MWRLIFAIPVLVALIHVSAAAAQGAEIFLKDPDGFAAFVQADAIRMRALIKSTNMKAEVE